MSEQITKDLGGITAYAAAVAAGYTGTKAQFETLMASYATVAQNAAASATAANGSAEDAEAYAVGTRDGSDVGSTDPAYHNNAKYYAEEAETYADSIDPDTLAKIDGYYDTLGAGTAEQLTSNIYEEDNTPYNFRTSGGSIDIGDRETDMLVGGTVAWNQLVLDSDQNFTSAISDTRPFTLQLRMFGSPYTTAFVSNLGLGKGIYTRLFVGIDTQGTGLYLTHNGSATNIEIWRNLNQQLVVGHKYLFNVNVVNNDTTTVGGLVLKDMMLIDLTQMFGTTIADYIYSLETANAGAGVAWFKKYFPKPYYAYNAGELMSVKALRHITRGFNAWDEEWALGWWNYQTGAFTASNSFFACKNKIPCLPNTTYYWKSPINVRELQFYNADGNALGSRQSYAENFGNVAFTTPNDCYYLTFYFGATYGTTYKNDICINLSWDGERDGEYEPYEKHSYPLDSSLTLRGIPKLDASNNLYYDGDVYEPDGTVTRKYGVVDLGTLTWIKNTNVIKTYFQTNSEVADMKKSTGNTIIQPIFCANYISETWAHALDNASYDKAICAGYGDRSYVAIADSLLVNLDAAAFKTAMSGVYLVYELATPTTEQADPYNGTQIVDDFGTEEYVDAGVAADPPTRDVAIPVGHETQYMANLKAKLEMSPNSPEGAGDYIVRQTNGENEYVTLASNATIQNIIARLEALEGGGE